MAKRRRSNRRYKAHTVAVATAQRDTRRIPKYVSRPPLYPPNSLLSPVPAQDRRRYSPHIQTVRTVIGTPARVRAKFSPRRAVPSRLAFINPRRVLTCVRRKVRREVLHAKRNTGKGARSQRRRRNQWSKVSC